MGSISHYSSTFWNLIARSSGKFDRSSHNAGTLGHYGFLGSSNSPLFALELSRATKLEHVLNRTHTPHPAPDFSSQIQKAGRKAAAAAIRILEVGQPSYQYQEPMNAC